MGSPDFFLYAKHLSVSLEIPLKDFRRKREEETMLYKEAMLTPSNAH